MVYLDQEEFEKKFMETIEKGSKENIMIFATRKQLTLDLFNILGSCHTEEGVPFNHALVGGGISLQYSHEPFLPRDMMYGTNNPIYIPPRIVNKEKLWDEGILGRKCFKCQTKIGYGDFRLRNLKMTMTSETLKKIWKSPYVQLYCCNCFNKKGSFDKLVKKRERLINKAYRINEKFGFLVD